MNLGLTATSMARKAAAGSTGSGTTSPHAQSAASQVASQAAAHVGSSAPAVTLASTGSIDYVREMGAMLVVFGLLFLLARYMKKRAGLPLSAKLTSGGQIRVLSRQSLSKGVSIAIVHVAGRDLLVGVTPTGVSLLTEVDVGEDVAGLEDEAGAFPDAASVEGGTSGSLAPGLARMAERFDGGSGMGTASPLQAWMAKLDGLREMTVRRS